MERLLARRSRRVGEQEQSARNPTLEDPIFCWRRNSISGGHRKSYRATPLAQSTGHAVAEVLRTTCEAPVPVDLRAIRALKRSPLSLDLYAWATRRVSYLKRPLRISWRSFQVSFGAGYADTPQGRSCFRSKAIEALRRVVTVYPQLNIESQENGLLLRPSCPHIPKVLR